MIGSLPRSSELIEAQRSHRDGELTAERLAHLQEKDIERVLAELEETGSPQLTDGELMKPSFLSYPVGLHHSCEIRVGESQLFTTPLIV